MLRASPQGPEVVLAAGKDFNAGRLTTSDEAFVLSVGSMDIALAIALVTPTKRSKKKRQLLPSQTGLK
jgi:hypothetical protein